MRRLLPLLCLLAACGARQDGPSAPFSSRVWPPAGGAATVRPDPQLPFLQLAPLQTHEWQGVAQGRELFMAVWRPSGVGNPLLDGLGPQFVANACAACHGPVGRIDPFLPGGEVGPSLLFRLHDAAGAPHPRYGGQLQSQRVSGPPEALVKWAMHGPARRFLLEGAADLPASRLGPRLAPQLVGMGLLDAVPESVILEYADPDDHDGDGVSGRAHWVKLNGKTRLGRFGWKASNPTLAAQSAEAFNEDMGLTTPLFPIENCTDQPNCPQGEPPEVSEASLAAVSNFLAVLGVPERRVIDAAAFDRGAATFEHIGCAACHRPTLRTDRANYAALERQTFYPYTDLLLHDMGPDLASPGGEKNASPSEWRTPPLWGLGLSEARVYLHDGRAGGLKEAVLWHGGEASGAKSRFEALSAAEEADLLEFLRGL